MAHTFYARPRLTHRYRDAWSHMDKHGKAIPFKLLAGRITTRSEEFDEIDTQVFRAIGDKRGDQALQARALRDSFGGSSCTHDFDCCGCISYHAEVRPLRPGVFFIRLSGTRNY